MTQTTQKQRLRNKQLLLNWIWQSCCAMLLLATTLLCVAWIRIEGTRLGYDIALLHQQQQQLQQQKRLFLLEIYSRKRPDKLYPLLQQRLGLAPAKLQQMHQLR